MLATEERVVPEELGKVDALERREDEPSMLNWRCSLASPSMLL